MRMGDDDRVHVAPPEAGTGEPLLRRASPRPNRTKGGSSIAAMAARTPTALWLVDAELVVALDARLGPPIDSYLIGSQTWLTPDGPGGIELEWRLHPVAGYQTPGGLS